MWNVRSLSLSSLSFLFNFCGREILLLSKNGDTFPMFSVFFFVADVAVLDYSVSENNIRVPSLTYLLFMLRY